MSSVMLVGIRGATTVDRDEPQLIRGATREMLQAIMERNLLAAGDVVSALFTLTDDLRSEFPARAARELGWGDVPMLCAVEVPVPGSLARCIRVLVHARGGAAPARHVYLGEARALRPELGDES